MSEDKSATRSTVTGFHVSNLRCRLASIGKRLTGVHSRILGKHVFSHVGGGECSLCLPAAAVGSSTARRRRTKMSGERLWSMVLLRSGLGLVSLGGVVEWKSGEVLVEKCTI